MNISWLKLDVNILDDSKIRIIRSFPDGDSLVVLWIGLLCLAMKSHDPGVICITEALPYTVDDLSNLFSIEKKTVELGLGLFTKYQMIEQLPDGSIEVINFAARQNLELIEHKRELNRVRVARHREKQCNALLTHDSITGNATDKNKNKNKKENKNNPLTPRKQKTQYSDDFIEFWSAYPKKTGKDAAWRAWKNRNGDRPPTGSILAAIYRQRESDQWTKDGGQYIPNPATWINRGSWADELPAGGKANGTYQRVNQYGRPVPRAQWEDDADRVAREYEQAKAAEAAANREAGKEP